jgi:exodeoxyribonuclease-3
MTKIKLISWNVNGIRAIYKKGFLDFIEKEKPDILGLQETKAKKDQIPPGILMLTDYFQYWESGEKPGYSGVGLLSRIKPGKIETGFGIKKFDHEGRIIIAYYQNFILYNVYFPNGKASPERLKYKMEFYDAFLEHADKKKNEGNPIIVCGDFNTAHKEIDLARPKENENVSGFLPEERAWIDKFISHGYIDTLRMFYPDTPGLYTWWSMRTRARERNVGWRLDYFFVSEDLKQHVKDAFILSNVYGSDHCPVGIILEF